MASIVSAGTTSATALNMSADTTGILQLASNNGTVGLTMDTSQNVGIGTSSPSYKLDVNGVAQISGIRQSYQTGLYTVDGALSNYSAINGVYLNGNATGWLTLRGDGTGTNYIQINGSSYGEPNLQRFFTASTERMRIDSAGTVTQTSTSSNAFNIASTNAFAGGNSNFVTMYLSGITSGTVGLALGKSGSTYNTSKIIFGYAGSGSSSNYLGLGFWDADSRLTIYPTGNASLTGALTQNTSDDRLKTDFQVIKDALEKVRSLSGFTHAWNELAVKLNSADPTIREAGVSAQKVKEVLPEAVCIAPFDQVKGNRFESESGEDYLTVMYEKLVPLLIEAVKELEDKVITLETKVGA
jgi:hypothetical protein